MARMLVQEPEDRQDSQPEGTMGTQKEQLPKWRVNIVQSAIGRPISRAKALRIVRQILEQAERERLEIAEFEAARGIQWEDKA